MQYCEVHERIAFIELDPTLREIFRWNPTGVNNYIIADIAVGWAITREVLSRILERLWRFPEKHPCIYSVIEHFEGLRREYSGPDLTDSQLDDIEKV